MPPNGQPQNGQKSGLSWVTPAAGAKPAAPAVTQKTLPVPVANTSTNMAAYIGTLVCGIVIGVLLAWGYSALRGDSASVAANTTKADTTASVSNSTSDTPTIAASSDSLTVASSQKAGMNVAVSKVVVNKPTWVVVYDNVNGKPGNTMGAHLFFTTGSGTVTLLRATTAGTTYFVGVRADNGDRKYARATDKAITNADGSEVISTFVAQ